MKRLLITCLLLMSVGCVAKKPAGPPVPGSIDTLDARAFRAIADAQAALHSIKTWEVCSAASFPLVVQVDNATEPCDKTSGPFLDSYKPYLNTAIKSYNTAADLGKAYHTGASNDADGLTAAINQLGSDVATLLANTGRH